MAKLGCQNSETPELINIKLGTGPRAIDYVGDITPRIKAIARVGAWAFNE